MKMYTIVLIKPFFFGFSATHLHFAFRIRLIGFITLPGVKPRVNPELQILSLLHYRGLHVSCVLNDMLILVSFHSLFINPLTPFVRPGNVCVSYM